MSSVPEKDWKTFRKLKDELLSSACERVFQRVNDLSASRTGRVHKAYLELYSLIQKENLAIEEMFDDLRRSNALLKLSALRRHGILTDEHMIKFTDETRNRINELVNFMC